MGWVGKKLYRARQLIAGKKKFVQSQLCSNASDLQSRSLEAQAEINSTFEIYI